MNSLEDEVWPRVDGLADVIVGREGEDLGPAAGPHRPAVQRMHRLAQKHDRRVDVSHSESFNRLPVLLLGGREEEEENEGPHCCWMKQEDEVGVKSEQNVRISAFEKSHLLGTNTLDVLFNF